MKITTITYHKTYNLGNYCSEKIGLEATIDETEQSIHDAAKELKEYCDEIHKQNNPHLYQEQATIIPEYIKGSITGLDKQGNAIHTDYSTPPEEKISIEQGRINTINSIKACQSIEELKTWKMLTSLNPEINESYQEKLAELSK